MMGKFGLVPAKRRSIGVNKGRQSPRGLGISGMPIRKAVPYRAGNRKPMFADRNQVSVLQKGINLLSNEGHEDDAASTAETSGFGSKKAPMKVAVRVRPLNSREKTANAREIIQVSGPNMLIFDPERQQEEFFYRNEKLRDVTARKYKNQKFAFDHVYDAGGTNQSIYEDIMKPLLSTLLSGFNCSVFAYGATGSGKTYTMLGSSGNRGLTYLTINDLYTRLESMNAEYETEVVISYFEVYNEQVRDLLNSNGKQLTIMEVGNGIAIKDLSFHHPRDIDHLLEMLRDGNANRSQHPTDHNAESSRSHAVLQVHIRMRERHKDMNSSSRTSKLVMVDLAGSEKGCATGFSGQRFREGSSINKSLLALGKIMENLASGKRTFSFRDSKLTRILKDSLGGNCRTVMIANISPAAALYDDTLNTLRYAQKAKKISCNASKNIITVQSCLSQYTRVMDEMTAKIQGLEKQLKEKDEDIEVKDQLLKEKGVEIGMLREENLTLNCECALANERANALEEKLRMVEEKLREPETIFQGTDHLFPANSQVPGNQQWHRSTNIVPKAFSSPIIIDTEVNQALPFDPEDPGKTNKERLKIKYEKSFRMFDAEEISDFLDSEGDFHVKIFPKLEKLCHDFQLKLAQYYKLRSLNGATADHKYTKSMTKAHGKLTALITASQKTLHEVRNRFQEHEIPKTFVSKLSIFGATITSEQLWKYIVHTALLKVSLGEKKVLKEQVDNLTSQLLRREELLKDFAKLSNQLYNNLKHYGHLSPAIKAKYEKLVSSYCSPSLKFAENYEFIESSSYFFLRKNLSAGPENIEPVVELEHVMDSRHDEFRLNTLTVAEMWREIHSRIVDIPEIQHQIGNLLQITDLGIPFRLDPNFLIGDFPSDFTTEFDLDSTFDSFLPPDETCIFSSTQDVTKGQEQLPDVNVSAESVTNQTVTLTQSKCFNDTFTLDQQVLEQEKEINENDDPCPTFSCDQQVELDLEMTSSVSNLFEIKTVPECVAEFSGRIGAKMSTTPPTFGYNASSNHGSLQTMNYLSPGASPSGAGPSHGYTHKHGRIPVITPRSASPQKTYQLSLGANYLKRVASVGKLPTSAKIQAQSTSPYCVKSKKAALNTLRTTATSNQYRHLLPTKTKPAVVQKNQQQQKGAWLQKPASYQK